MEKFKFVGKKPNPDMRKASTGLPIDEQRFAEHERYTFRTLFREQVTETVRNSGGLFREGIYGKLSSQYGSFDRLEDLINAHKFQVVEIVRCSNNKDEFLCRVQLRIPTLPAFNDKLFTGGIPEGHKGFVVVSFYIGVCRSFTTIIKAEQLYEIVKLTFPLDEVHGHRDNGCAWPVEKFLREPDIRDEAFDPDNVVPSLIKNLRLEKRYNYQHATDHLIIQRHYQSPEGYLYHINIDGYMTQPS